MRTGLLQQVGSPKELYDTPVNLFVAGFIGSPAMNFMAGTFEDGMLRTPLGDFRLGDRMRREVESAGAGRDVIVGLRPENFEDASLVSADNRQHGITFNTGIDVLESMGSDVYVYFTRDIEQGVNAAELEELARDSGRADTGASGDTLVARLDAATGIHEGQDAELWVDSRALHIFDPSSGRNLSLGATGDGSASTVTSGAAAPAASSPAPPSPEPAGGQAPPSPAPAGPAQADPGPASAGDTATGGEVT
jgi:multiple sugar transport system ATP-binding protein